MKFLDKYKTTERTNIKKEPKTNHNELFKALIIQNAEQPLADETYFPKYLKAHIDRGAKMLLAEYKYSNNNFYQHLVEIDKGI